MRLSVQRRLGLPLDVACQAAAAGKKTRKKKESKKGSRPTFYLLVIQPATPLASSPSRRLAAPSPARASPARARLSTPS